MLVLTLLLCLLPVSLFAYLDPGTGTALVNIIIAGAMALVYSMKGLFLRLIHKNNNDLKEKMIRKEDIKISIFSEGKQYWNSYKAIIEELIKSKVAFYYYTADIEDPALLIENELMHSKFLGYNISLRAKFIEMKGDILITTTPNIGAEHYLPKPKNIKKMIHFFHSVSDISMYKKHSLDFYDAVYLAGDFQQKSIREIEAKRNSKSKKIISLGLPYIDELMISKNTSMVNKKNKIILIGSSWGEKGLLNFYGTDFIKDIAKMDIDVIIRPHPQSLKSEKALIRKYKNELKNIRNIIWDEKLDPTKSMSISDLLISDTSSLRFDYAFIYEKPIITLDIPKNAMSGFERDDLTEIWSEKVSNKIGYVVNSRELASIRKYVNKINNEFDGVHMTNLRNSVIANFGSSAEAIVHQLKIEIQD